MISRWVSVLLAVALGAAAFWGVLLAPVFINADDPKWDGPGNLYYGLAFLLVGVAVAMLRGVQPVWFALGVAGSVVVLFSMTSAPPLVHVVCLIGCLAPIVVGMVAATVGCRWAQRRSRGGAPG